MRTHRSLTAALLGVAALTFTLAACGSESSDHSGGPPAHRSSVLDWTPRHVDVDDDRWTVAFCEGDAPILCLTDEAGNRGGVELTTWNAAGYDVIRQAWDAGADDVGALEALAEDHAEIFVADRAEGCGSDYEVVPDEPTVVDMGGHEGLRFGFRGIRDGVTVEHSLIHAVIVDGLLHLMSTSALADDGCLGREGEFDIATFDAATIGLLGRLASASVLPTTCSACAPADEGSGANDA